MFLLRHWFLLLFLGVFIVDYIFSLHCFFRCFYFTSFRGRDCFLSGTSFLCCCTASATNLRERFLLSGVFTLYSFPIFSTNCINRYINLFQVLNPLINSYMYCKANFISSSPQKFLWFIVCNVFICCLLLHKFKSILLRIFYKIFWAN